MNRASPAEMLPKLDVLLGFNCRQGCKNHTGSARVGDGDPSWHSRTDGRGTMTVHAPAPIVMTHVEMSKRR